MARRSRALLVSLLCAGVAGCALLGPSGGSGPAESRASALSLVSGESQRGGLHCEEGICARWYRVTLDEPGALHIEVNAASGSGVPDFDMRLEDAEGEVLWGDAPTGHTPRVIERVLPPGDYYVVVESIGEMQGPLAYEASVRLRPTGPVFQAGGPRPAGRKGRPKNIPRRPEIWASAEIVRVEGSRGTPDVVILDGGSLDGWRVGNHGELLEGGAVIATFSLVDVGDAQSRGRLDAPPSDTITFETRARVRVPLREP